jgi:hypothetical protein
MRMLGTLVSTKALLQPQPPRQGLALLEPAADDLTDRLVAGQEDEDRNDLHGPLGPENPHVILAKQEDERRNDDHQ